MVSKLSQLRQRTSIYLRGTILWLGIAAQRASIYLRRSIPWLGIAVLILVLDQVTKFIALQTLSVIPTPVFPFLSLTLACNTGAAFSMFEGHGSLLAIAGIFFAVFFTYMITRLDSSQWLEGCAFASILGGAVGNVVDRIVRGCVLDFVHVHYGSWHFPIFNLADSAITIGAGLWLLSLILSWSAERQEVKAKD